MSKKKVVKFRKKFSFVKYLAIAIIVYILIFGFITLSKKVEKTYEVHAGSLSADTAYKGFIIREEQVVNSLYAGNLNYYVREDTRVRKGDTIYTVDETGRVATLLDEMNSGENHLIKEDVEDIRIQLNMYKNEYSGNNFYDVYGLKTEINSTLLRATNRTLVENLDSLIEQTGSSNLFQLVQAEKTGIVEYTIDGYENVKLETFSPDMLNRNEYSTDNLYLQNIIVKDNPVYRLVTNENWYVVFPLSASDIEKYQLNSKNSLNITFKKNKIKAIADFSLRDYDGQSYGILELKDYMVRFADDRYVDFEISTSSYEGLKLPTSSITEMNFFVVPAEYITTGDNSNNEGFYCEYYNETGAKVTDFVKAKIYYKTEKECYVHTSSLSAGYTLIKPKSEDRFVVGEKKPLPGVFCVNNGYTVFKRIEIVENGKEYTIVKKGVSSGISLYDRILLDSEGKKEGELIY